MTIRCHKHKRFKGTRPPTSACRSCNVLFDFNFQVKHGGILVSGELEAEVKGYLRGSQDARDQWVKWGNDTDFLVAMFDLEDKEGAKLNAKRS